MDAKRKWDGKYAERLDENKKPESNEKLKEFAPYFQGGKALDLACGLGGNSFYLASLNYEVIALDISDVAIKHVEEQANLRGLSIQARACDLTKIEKLALQENDYDLTIITNYLDRNLFTILPKIVKEKGFIFIETFYATPENTDKNDHMPEKFKLQPKELLEVFKDWHILYYEENEFSGRQTIFARKGES